MGSYNSTHQDENVVEEQSGLRAESEQSSTDSEWTDSESEDQVEHTLTENGSLAYNALHTLHDKNREGHHETLHNEHYGESGEIPRVLAFFFRAVREIRIGALLSMFDEAFNENPELCIKVLLNLRDIRIKETRGSNEDKKYGCKGEKFISQVLMAYLKFRSPSLYTKVLPIFLSYGYWKDILKVSYIAAEYCNYHRIKEIQNEAYSPILYDFTLNLQDEVGLFASALTKDSNAENISLVAKWAPREGSHYDKAPLYFARRLMKHLHLSNKEYRVLISSLSKKLNTVERCLSLHEESNIDFKSLPSVAHFKHRQVFLRTTDWIGNELPNRKILNERYLAYIAQPSRINSQAVELTDLVKYFFEGRRTEEEDLYMEHIFKEKLLSAEQSGAFLNSIAVVDVSGSMRGTPMYVSMGLGIMTALLTKGSFNRKMITFSERPSWFALKGNTLGEYVSQLKSMPWGANTNIEAVFNLLIEHAEEHTLIPEQMVKKIFIFTDMQFDRALNHDSHTLYEQFADKFLTLGYKMPDTIFWNLRATKASFPICDTDLRGVALMSGYSESLLKSFLNTKEMNPSTILFRVLSQYILPFDITSEDLALKAVSIESFIHACDKAHPKKHFRPRKNILVD